MLMELDVKYINPHQDTSVLGQIMPNYLALNPTVNYRKFFDNNCTLSMEGLSLDRFGNTMASLWDRKREAIANHEELRMKAEVRLAL